MNCCSYTGSSTMTCCARDDDFKYNWCPALFLRAGRMNWWWPCIQWSPLSSTPGKTEKCARWWHISEVSTETNCDTNRQPTGDRSIGYLYIALAVHTGYYFSVSFFFLSFNKHVSRTPRIQAFSIGLKGTPCVLLTGYIFGNTGILKLKGKEVSFFLFFFKQTGTYRLTNLTTQITLCDISVTTSSIYIYYTKRILYFLTFLHSTTKLKVVQHM